MNSSLHILIIDDQPESLIGLAGQLSDRGHRVEILSDSLEALNVLQQTQRDPFQLFFIDVNLPGLDGPGLVRELRRRGDRTPVAFITGYQSVAGRLRNELGELRAIAVLLKPAPSAEVEHVLHEALRFARQQIQDRRATEFGSGGHATISRTPGTLTPMSNDIPFYGTTRSIRQPTPQSDALTDGALARVEKPSGGPDIISDDIFTGKIPHPRTPLPVTSATRRGTRTPLPELHAGRGLDGSSASTLTPSRHINSLQPGDLPSSAGPLLGYRDPVTGVYKQKSGLFPPDALQPQTREAPAKEPGTTSRFRRSVGERPVDTPPPTPGTSRIRRSISGSFIRPTAADELAPTAEPETCAVACAHCNGQFKVLVKAERYTVMCIHCGKLNRIEPLE